MKRKLLSVFGFIFLLMPGFGQVAELHKANDKLPSFQNPFKRAKIPTMVTIDYQFHKGRCVLKTGKILEGNFRFDVSAKNVMNHYHSSKILKAPVIEFNDPENKIRPKDILTLTLEGKDSLLPTHSPDSTFFTYSQAYSQLLRLNFDNGIQTYDELYIVDELDKQKLVFWAVNTRLTSSPSNMTGSVSVSYDELPPAWEFVDSLVYADLRRGETFYAKVDDKILKLKDWDDVSKNFRIDPYIRNLADTLRKFESRDVFFGLVFSYSKEKLKQVPFFRNIEISLEDGRKVTGLGYVQPSCYMGYSYRGIVHYYDGKQFTFFKPGEIKKVIFENREYIPVYDNWYKFYLMAFRWIYNDTEFRVVEEVEPLNNFYNYSDYYKHRIYEKKKGDTWKWVSGPDGNGLINDYNKQSDKVTK
jgi:hypothetical protein